MGHHQPILECAITRLKRLQTLTVWQANRTQNTADYCTAAV